jgi:hypothetical protein
LLVYLTNLYNEITIIDAGTNFGHSCLALAQNLNNKILTYDIVPKNLNFLNQYPNVSFKQMDINNESEEILKSNNKVSPIKSIKIDERSDQYIVHLYGLPIEKFDNITPVSTQTTTQVTTPVSTQTTMQVTTTPTISFTPIENVTSTPIVPTTTMTAKWNDNLVYIGSIRKSKNDLSKFITDYNVYGFNVNYTHNIDDKLTVKLLD